ncbi:aspartate-semialdehyde dehydrogenase [Peredibacter starrii]|uniref:Aspartate-semialdehyde dehydrogenase n=1 Tax=Peredibacter starrii TaxID=28202 RepID=A0AAX4HJL0_9BACT|nr:aspartate-semialdehyde dehydrogenase [Peredibacter starrii]WPU63418.1 aspartate-semialdehyde dehydrogenase [Peredibacter starrii]
MKKVGFIGWRGMVGSVLMERMKEENDFSHMESYFFSTSQTGEAAPKMPNSHDKLLSAMDSKELSKMDILVSCQGGDYTTEMFPLLRKEGWNGIWIDAASTLRMKDDSVIVLDPVNRNNIQEAINKGTKNFVGGNCTVSLLLIALHGLFKENMVEWVSSMTYQAASGAGAKNMIELLDQMKSVGTAFSANPAADALTLEKQMTSLMTSSQFPTQNFGHPLALNVLPWIDSEMPSGQSKEEWKAQVEANKILQSQTIIPIDGTCVRVGALRCHSQGLTIKLKKSAHLSTVEEIIASANDWVRLVPNNKPDTLKALTPAAVSGKMHVPIGRIRPMTIGDSYFNAFTLGDQLLWGAAEPLRCVLRQVLQS